MEMCVKGGQLRLYLERVTGSISREGYQDVSREDCGYACTRTVRLQAKEEGKVNTKKEKKD